MIKRLALVTAAGGTLLLLTACGGLQEAVCGGGEYPVANIGSTGSACQAEGTEPDAGWIRYPEGKVPEKVGDKWDTYWNEHILDEDGNESPAPAETN
ncbi:SCO0607 family lipoprotein [Kineosporia babensis]